MAKVTKSDSASNPEPGKKSEAPTDLLSKASAHKWVVWEDWRII